MAIKRGQLTREKANVIFVIDASASMFVNEERIGKVNYAMPLVKKSLVELADRYHVDCMMRVLIFGKESKWIIGDEKSGVNVKEVVWKDIDEELGLTNMADALDKVNQILTVGTLAEGSSMLLRPVVIMMTDGYCNTQYHEDFLKQVEIMRHKLTSSDKKEKVTRIGIGISENYSHKNLEEFASMATIQNQLHPLVFDDKKTDLSEVINWATATSVESSITGEKNFDSLTWMLDK
ncbi:MAG: VWA domain-containing protein [Erysipelotrichaceae bacterium]|nr:VWA domain-containing protein [Erysipelotrichaceae bacterium]